MKMYILGCVALGLTTGFLVGASNSPVVQYVLPLLFALIAGSAGVLAAKSARARTTDDKFRVIGASTLALATPFLLAVLYGSLVRTGASVESLLPRLHRDEQSFLSRERAENLLSDDLLKLAIIDRNLSFAGVRDKERETIVQLIADRRVSEIKNFEKSRDALHQAASRLIDDIKNFSLQSKDDDSSSLYVDELLAKANLFRKSLASQTVTREQAMIVVADIRQAAEKVMEHAYARKNATFQEDVTTLLAMLQNTPDSEIVNKELRQELSSLLKDGKQPSTEWSGNFPFLAVNPRTSSPRT